MARPRTADKRKRILQAAVGVFARKGYFGARVSEIAKKAGVADGTIYLYFRNKEDILVSLFDDLMSEHVQQVKDALPRVPDAESRLRLVAEHHLRALGENRDLAVVFQVELRQSTKFMERFTASWLQDYFALLGEIITKGQAAGELRADLPVKLGTKAFFGSLDEMVTSWILGGKGYDLAELAAPVVDLFLRGAAAPASPPQRKDLADRRGRREMGMMGLEKKAKPKAPESMIRRRG
jgi:TetR/AcrR family fatty acid metabolism transcriptional regulator